MGKNRPAMQEAWIQPLGPGEGNTGTYSSIAWRIPWTEEPGRQQSIWLITLDLFPWIWRCGKDRTFPNKHNLSHIILLPQARPVSLASRVKRENSDETRATLTPEVIGIE